MRTKEEIIASEGGKATADDYETMRLAVVNAQSTANNAVALMWAAADEAAMLALASAKKGHFAKRSDVQSGYKWVYILNQLPASTLENWSPFAIWYTNATGGGAEVVAYTPCGEYASTSENPYPTTGGTGDAGAIKAGNVFVNTGTYWLGRAQLIAKIDTPGTNADNWEILQAYLPITPVSIANRVGAVAASDVDFPTNTAVINYLVAQLSDLIGTLSEPSTTKYVAVTELINALNLKADINYVHGLIKGFAWKENVRVATTANITLSGTQTIDTIALAVDNRVLVKNQTDATQNGIYLVKSDTWLRADDADNAAELRAATVNVEEGTTNGDKQFTQTTDSIVLGTSNINWKETGGAATFAGLIGAPSDNTALAAALAEAVKITGAQTIAGAKEFSTGLKAFRESKEVTSTSYVFVLGDRGMFVIANNTASQTFTIPPVADVAFPIDTEIEVWRDGTGEVTILGGVGVTIKSAGNRYRIAERYLPVTMKHIAPNVWALTGGLKA